MKKILIIALLGLIYGHSNLKANNAIIKANIVRGESFVTVKADASKIEEIIEGALYARGIKRITNCKEAKYFVDIFSYQFPAAVPTMVITIRTKEGIHYIDRRQVDLYTDRKNATLRIARKIAKRLPQTIDTTKYYDTSSSNIINYNSHMGLTPLISYAIMEGRKKKHINNIDWGENKQITFMFDNFQQYLNHCINYQGIRRKIKKYGPIKVELSIDESGTSTITNIISPTQLKEREKKRLKETIAALPIWINESKYENVLLTFDLIK